MLNAEAHAIAECTLAHLDAMVLYALSLSHDIVRKL